MDKLVIFIFLLLSNILASSQGVWLSQSTGFDSVQSGVGYINVVDTNCLWITAYDGLDSSENRQDYSRTIDGGTNWSVGYIPAPATYHWSMIFGISNDTAWSLLHNAATQSGGGIWKTFDGGQHWEQQDSAHIYNNLNSFPNSIHFWDADTGISIGNPSANNFEIYYTDDGGDQWNRVPVINVPSPLNNERGRPGHYIVIGDTIWFDTDMGRVFRSVDKGVNWTVSSTGIIIPQNESIDICFYNSLEGVARHFDKANGINTIKRTMDGGDTWMSTTFTGTMFGADIKHIPGTLNHLISSGADSGFIGTSVSDDGGLSWSTIESSEKRTRLGIVDSLHMWVGGFTIDPFDGGIYKFQFLDLVNCGDLSINSGHAIGSDTLLCVNDTLTITASGINSPTVGDYFGLGWIISSADITGSVFPLLEPSIISTYAISMPVAPTDIRTFINDGSLIDGVINAYGVYYLTPVAFGNGSSPSNPQLLSDLSLDPACTYTGNSVRVDIADPADSRCSTVHINKLEESGISSSAFQDINGGVRMNIKAPSGANIIVEIYDMEGRKIHVERRKIESGINSILIEMSPLPSGIYFIKTYSKGTLILNKLFIV